MSDAPARPRPGATCLVLALADADEPATRAGVLQLLEQPDVDVVLVAAPGDPAVAGWAGVLAEGRPARCVLLMVAAKTARAETVRQGLQLSIARGADIVGYAAADFSTPASEVIRLRDVMRSRGASVVMGSRVAMLGYDIRRSAVRHYLGRVFAMIASVVLRTAIYDTQCAMKLFRPSPALDEALATPFSSTVAFDVELLGRLLVGAPGMAGLSEREIIEVPLRAWHGTSKSTWTSTIGPVETLSALRDLRRIAADLNVRRRVRGASA
jgi:dolichyl-phosphate beta-glucosyltransferase